MLAGGIDGCKTTFQVEHTTIKDTLKWESSLGVVVFADNTTLSILALVRHCGNYEVRLRKRDPSLKARSSRGQATDVWTGSLDWHTPP